MKKKEYGGYLPLELNEGQEFYKFSDDDMLRVNCGRSAILCAINDGGYKKIYIPFYTCKSVSEALEKNNISYEFYHIDSNFDPIGVDVKEGELLLWTNYFGIMNEQHIQEIVSRYKQVLLDNTQAFFVKPVMQVYNAYSCRKFFGVCDGAYLVHTNLRPIRLEKDKSTTTALYMLEAIENGTNYAYQKSLDNEKRIEESGILEMSKLTQNILSSINYDRIINKRRDNFEYMHSKLKEMNELKVYMYDQVPMAYPLLINNDGLRKYLVDNLVYVPQWWKWVGELQEANEFEKKLSNYLFALPIDQRYDIEDMDYLCDLVKEYIKS